MENKIQLKDLGPITDLTVNIDGPGVYVAKGGPGSGKSTALRTIGRTLGGRDVKADPDITVRDGAERGFCEIGALRLTVTSRQTVSGLETSLSHLESRFDITALVDPGIADKKRADAARIKSLVALYGVTADESHYYELCGGQAEFEAMHIDTNTSDPVLLSSRVKAGFHALARRQETEADKSRGEAAALAARVGDQTDLPEPPDDAALQAALDVATAGLAGMESQIATADESANAVAEAQAAFAALPVAVAVDDIEAEVVGFSEQLHEANRKVKQLEADLADAQHESAMLLERHASAELRLTTAKQHETQRVALQAVVSAAVPPRPTAEQLEAAQAEKQSATEAMAQAQSVRETRKMHFDALAATERAKLCDGFAEAARANGLKTEAILASLIPAGALRIVDERLVAKTDRSDAEMYDELSDGEKYRIAIDIAVEVLATDPAASRIMVVQQPGWEGLPDSVRQDILAQAIESNVAIVTGQVNDGPLTFEKMEATGINGQN